MFSSHFHRSPCLLAVWLNSSDHLRRREIPCMARNGISGRDFILGCLAIFFRGMEPTELRQMLHNRCCWLCSFLNTDGSSSSIHDTRRVKARKDGQGESHHISLGSASPSGAWPVIRRCKRAPRQISPTAVQVAPASDRCTQPSFAGTRLDIEYGPRRNRLFQSPGRGFAVPDVPWFWLGCSFGPRGPTAFGRYQRQMMVCDGGHLDQYGSVYRSGLQRVIIKRRNPLEIARV